MAVAPARVVRALVSSGDAPARAVSIGWGGWHPTVADLASAVGLGDGALWVDDQMCLGDELVDSLDLHDGSVVADRGPGESQPSLRPAGTGLLVIEQIAGPASGAYLEVEPGTIAARPLTWTGQSSTAAELDGPRRARPALPQVLAPPAAIFELSLTPAATGGDVGGNGVEGNGVGGNGAGGNTRAGSRWYPGEVRALGPDLFRLHQTTHGRVRTPGTSGLVRGQRVVRRSPRIIEPIDIEPIVVPVPPAEPKAPPRLSWAVMLAPLPIGVLIAFLFRPIFLLFTALGPMMSLGRWLEGRIRHRRESTTWRTEMLANEAALRAEVDAAASTHADQLRDRSLTLAGLADRISSGGPGLWERRPDHDDFGEVVVGYADRPWSPPLGAGATNVEVVATLRHVPHTLRIDHESVVGVVGPTIQRRAVARAIVLQLAGLHGPADLGLAVPDSPQWDWCKWLPHGATSGDGRSSGPGAAPGHSSSPSDSASAGLGASPSDSASAGLGASPGHNATHGHAGALNAERLVVSLGEQSGGPGPVLVDAPAIETLPARCTQVIVIEDGLARVLDLGRGHSTDGLVPVGCSVQFAEGVARQLAPVSDGDAHQRSAPMPPLVSLCELDGPSEPDQVRTEWRSGAARSAATLQATLGSDGDDVVIDLVRDGPHALVAGTTGAGKSELLRTLVAGLAARYPPERCSFVLVDFKGGGAFDVLAPLPHVAAVVTDLDAGLAERALRSLRAEMRRREHVLREQAVSDLRHCEVSDTTPPRLVIVVDEFATLANDAPDFLDGLIDAAQRGRSLGVHLVLATQRPAGVVDNRIRANTNLRLCLRVSDAADSRDVIGTVDAAALPTVAVGRTWMRVGPEPARLFQCAHTGPGPKLPEPGTIAVSPFGISGDRTGDRTGDRARTGDVGLGKEAVPTTAPIVAAIAEAGAGRVPNAPPWLEPLSDPLPTDHLWGGAWVDAEEIPLGRIDLPDEQAQPVCGWSPATGALVIIGGDDDERASIAELIGQAAMERMALHGVKTAGVLSIGRPRADRKPVDPLDTERVNRALDWFMTHRGVGRASETGDSRRSGVPLLVVEDYGRLCADAEPRDRADAYERLNNVISGADATGGVVVMAASERSLPPRVLAGCGKRIALTLPDPTGYASLGIRLKSVPELGHLGGVEAPHGSTLRFATATTAHRVPMPPIDVVPEHLGQAELAQIELSCSAPPAISNGGAVPGLRVSIGIDLATCAVRQVDFTGRPMVIAGDQGSGRTSLLAAVIRAAREADPSVTILATALADAEIETFRAAGADRCGPHLTSPDLLAMTGPAADLIMVDDADALDAATAEALIAGGAGAGSTLVVAGTPRLFRSPRSPWSRLVDARHGIALGRGPAASDVWAVRPRWYPGVAPARGDATLVDGDSVTAVRLAAPSRPTVNAGSLRQQ